VVTLRFFKRERKLRNPNQSFRMQNNASLENRQSEFGATPDADCPDASICLLAHLATRSRTSNWRESVECLRLCRIIAKSHCSRR
jgi:hypothetical protein